MAAVRVLLLILLLLPAVSGKTPTEGKPGQPKPAQTWLGSFEGWFQWDSGSQKQPVRFKLERTVSTKGDVAILEGNGVYLDTGTRIRLRGELNTRTGALRLYEQSPEGNYSDSFVTDGYHQAQFSGGYSKLDGRWVPAPGGEGGQLHLKRH